MPLTFVDYLERRGYDLNRGSAAFLGHLFFQSWLQPGFHLFWRVWNPVYGYFLFRIYLMAGGNRRRVTATATVFLFCGFVFHDLPLTLAFGRLSLVCTTAFFFYAIATLASRFTAAFLSFDSWPRWIHGLINVGLVVLGLLFGTGVQRFLAGWGE